MTQKSQFPSALFAHRLAAALLSGCAVFLFSLAPARGQRAAPRFDPSALTTLRGTVAGHPGQPVSAGRVRLITAEGEIPVRLAPPWYLKRKELVLRAGDEIEVRGLRSKSGSSGFMIAVEVRRGNQVVPLRDATTGRPLWRAERRRMRAERQRARRTAMAARRTPAPSPDR